MEDPGATDPVGATLLAILELLRGSEHATGRRPNGPALGLDDLERRLQAAAPGGSKAVPVALALGLLVRQGLVQAQGSERGAWRETDQDRQLYQITPEGRQFLTDARAAAPRLY
jgi:hypothetical protein